MTDHVRELLLGPAHVERSKILVIAGIRAGIVATAILVCLTLAHLQAYAMAATVGAVFVAVADAGESIGRRWRSMLWATAWMMAGALIGGMAGDQVVVGLAVTAVVAFLAGAAGMLGPRGALIGLVTLVVFIVFAGAPESEATVLGNVALIGLGGLVMTAVTVVPALLRADARRAARAPVPPMRDRWQGRITLQDDFMRHGVRLAIVVTFAMAVSYATPWPHDYWLPMSVAWITRPDANGTATRILARLAGTAVGLFVVAVLVDVIHVSDPAMAVAAGVASGIAVAFIGANYAIATAGVTTFVVGLFSFDGDPVLETMGLRLGLTLAAGVVAFAGFYIWPPVARASRAASA